MEGVNAPGHEKINIKDPEEAREFISQMLEKGEKPCITVPEQYFEFIKDGLKPHSTWIMGFDAIVGTLGRDPYMPDEHRKIVYIKNIDIKNIQPRFTGPDNSFHGVIIVNGPIPPEKIEVMN